MGKPSVYGVPGTALPPVKGQPRDEARYNRIHKSSPKPPVKKSK